MASKPPSIRRRATDRLLIALALVMALGIFGCIQYRSVTGPLPDKALAPPAPPVGLRIGPPLPPGVAVQSTAQALRVTIAPRGESTDLLLIAPFGAEAQFRLKDARFIYRDGATTRSLALAEAEGPLADAIARRSWVACREAGVMRFCRILRLDADTRAVGLGPSRSLRPVRLVLEMPLEGAVAADAPAPALGDERGFALIFSRLVANPEAAALYANRAEAMAEIPDAPEKAPRQWRPNVSDPQARWLRMAIDTDGPVRIVPRHLADAGLPRADLSAVQVFCRGLEAPSAWLDGPGTSPTLVVSAMASDSPYSRESAYWLRVPLTPEARRAPRRMTPAQSPSDFPPNLRGNVIGRFTPAFEKDRELLIQQGNFLSIQGNKWVWAEVASTEPVRFPFDLYHLPPGTDQTVPLTIHLHFANPGDVDAPPPKGMPDLAVGINEAYRTRLAPPSGDARSVVCRVPASSLKRRGNVLEIAFAKAPPPTLGASVYVDRFEAEYEGLLIPQDLRMEFRTPGGEPWRRTAGFPQEAPLVLDLSNPQWPAQIQTHYLAEATYGFYEDRPDHLLLAAAPSALPPAPPLEAAVDTGIESEANAADYLIVYHRRFRAQVERLAGHHRKEGLRVAMAEIGEVFQKFSMGESTPEGLRAFLRHALRHWRVPPVYVCLFGDASSDYRGELKSQVENLLPGRSWQAENGDVWASELWYATLAGDDLLPDLLLGRIPAREMPDADEMVRKAVAYGSAPPMGPWRGRIGFVADDSGFRDATNMVRRELTPAAYAQPRVFVEELPYEDNFYVPRAIARQQNLKICTAATLEMLRMINRGIGMLIFFGHGSPNIWCDERVWFGGDSENSDNLNLRNKGRLPFVATFTCNHGAFDYPMPRWHICISEDMMRVTQGGAAALYVPSGPGLTAIHRHVARALMRALFARRVRPLGEALALATALYVVEGVDLETIRMFLLLGDPAMRLPMPETVVGGTIQLEYRTDSLPTPQQAKVSKRTFLARTPPDMPKGRFSAYLYDPDGREVARAVRLPFRRHAISWPLPPMPQAAPGQWTVRAYFGQPGAERDALAVARFDMPQADPNADAATTSDILAGIDLTADADSVRFEPDPPRQGETVYMRVRLRNRGDTPSPPFGLELWAHIVDRRPLRLEPFPESRQFHQQPLAPGATRQVRLRWDYPAYSEIAGPMRIALHIDPESRIGEADETNNVLETPLRILRAPNVEVVEARQPGRELELLDTRSSRTTPANIHLIVRVKNLGEQTAWQRKLGVYRREPKTPNEFVDPKIQIEEIDLPTLEPNQEETYEFRWATNWEDAKGQATARVYRTLKSVRTSPEEFVSEEAEW